MASHLEMEMNSCLTEMERLQSKMMELQQTKKQQDTEEEEKTKQIEPNMEVMEKWLKSIAKTKDEYTIEQKVNNIDMFRRSCGKVTEQEKGLFKQWVSIQEQRNRGKASSQHVELFQKKAYKRPDTPSQFMINFIEATHNLFQIQQKRIDELETVVAELNAKIE